MHTYQGKHKILVIEDNHGDFALVEDFLFEQIESPEIVRAESCKSAVGLLSADSSFDVVLLDLSLPDNTGELLIKDIIDAGSQAPVIVLTGYADFDFGVKSLSLGVFDYMLKEELTSLSLFKSIVYTIERKKIATALRDHVNAVENQNEKLKEISWIQSHLVRAPLARIMGLIPLIKDANCDEERETMLQFLQLSANELDGVIRSITDKTSKADFHMPE
ncbi:response regulator [Mucilaginibacter psychrotolerans]|uniref:Response regulator n=1 Tax=Mucilaginibacter psychrotolerans TaxID=1524096 RepID=A0A4Y8S709_9SPHI|nr:response regulator [Mucilaginibacter psychrotolerans]TFF34738.1 response regulator [Mucilaginibacter psychrotolerans]